jgi:hypothetical protein
LFVLNELREFLIFGPLAIRSLCWGTGSGDCKEQIVLAPESKSKVARREPKWEKLMGSCEAP